MPMLEASPQGQRPDPAAAIDLVLQESADADVCWYVVVCNSNPLQTEVYVIVLQKGVFEKSDAVFSRWLNVLDAGLAEVQLTRKRACIWL